MPRFLTAKLTAFIWSLAVLFIAGFYYLHYRSLMDNFEQGILLAASATLIYAGLQWRAISVLTLCVTVLTLLSFWLYGDDLANAQHNPLLSYFLSSSSAIMWMGVFFVLAYASYLIYLFNDSSTIGKISSMLTWTAITIGFTGMLVRWRESYLLGSDIGHIPISNLYEVFILFCVITALIYLYYEYRYKTKSMGSFIMPIIIAAVGFLMWYRFGRGADQIQPLVPALKSYWMKIHVPANFIGYGCFSIAAMLGAAYLLQGKLNMSAVKRFPDKALLEDAIYRVTALGFLFFTLATILGSLWAAEAWGGYWSWDPKETWALIVWLNYAAWLHMRMTHGWRGKIIAWWSIIGLFVTLFAFLGVNIFLSGLHSYGDL